MHTALRSLALLTTLLTSCAGEEEELVCIESVWCCSYTCGSEQDVEDRGPDNCDCVIDDELEPPEGTCMAMDGECDWH